MVYSIGGGGGTNIGPLVVQVVSKHVKPNNSKYCRNYPVVQVVPEL
jgi:hypothetical protein